MQRYRSFCEKAEIKALKQGDRPPQITGYASVFNQATDMRGYMEIVRPGAFDKSLAKVDTGEADIAAMIQHEGGLNVVARTSNKSLRLWVDDHGLGYEFTPPDTTAGRDLLTMVDQGLLTQSSFAFMVRDYGERWIWDTDPPLRELLDLELFEVSVVDFGAYPTTSVDVKALREKYNRLPSLEELQVEVYRDLSRRLDKKNTSV